MKKIPESVAVEKSSSDVEAIRGENAWRQKPEVGILAIACRRTFYFAEFPFHRQVERSSTALGESGRAHLTQSLGDARSQAS